MKFFANGINGQYLRTILPSPSQEVNWVKAAIAYATDASTLLQNSLDLGVRMDLWVRYDDTVAVAPPLLRKLNVAVKHNVFCHLVPDIHHAKLVWWSGYGVYIGSANLTDRAWNKNIEAGIFLSEAELESGGMLEQIEQFFVTLAAQPEVRPLTEEIILEQEALAQKLRATKNRMAEIGHQGRSLPKWEGMNFTPDKQPSKDKHRRAFLDEWNSALTYLRSIAEQVNDYRPSWLEAGVPVTWQTDQFLHAYYYKKVTGGRGHPYQAFHDDNKDDPASAVTDALIWWQQQTQAPSNEDRNLRENAPLIRSLLSEQDITQMTQERLTELLMATHASKEHMGKVAGTLLGLPANRSVSKEERGERYAAFLWNQRNERGESVPQVLHYVLYGGRWQEVPNRLFDAVFDDSRKIQHLATNQIAEMVGWAMPEHYPPRNGRTSKALKALGYPVEVRGS